MAKGQVVCQERPFKTHVAVNTNTGEILALEATNEKVHNGKMMRRLVDRMLKQNNALLSTSNQFWKTGPMTAMRVSSIFKRKRYSRESG